VLRAPVWEIDQRMALLQRIRGEGVSVYIMNLRRFFGIFIVVAVKGR
jgi:hypothetical protein